MVEINQRTDDTVILQELIYRMTVKTKQRVYKGPYESDIFVQEAVLQDAAHKNTQEHSLSVLCK